MATLAAVLLAFFGMMGSRDSWRLTDFSFRLHLPDFSEMQHNAQDFIQGEGNSPELET